jgi:sugar O-acyltransferase (sialic acid O-acetyltransferase NeuD family)
MKKKILLIGAGGHGKVVLDALLAQKEYVVAGIIDVKKLVGTKVLGGEVIWTDADLPRLFKSGIKYCIIAVGSIGDPGLRVKLSETAKGVGFSFPNVISPKAVVSPHAVLGEGNYVAPGAIINAGTRIGNHCIINTGAIVEHDCVIHDFVHLSPGAVLSGGVAVGDQSHIGSGSVVVQYLKIGSKVMIGAGSVVTKDVPDGIKAFGNPCRERKANS